MYIKFEKKSGQISSVSVSDKAEENENTLIIDNAKLPKDFTDMFAYGKYLVKEGKITENKKFDKPQIKKIKKSIEP